MTDGYDSELEFTSLESRYPHPGNSKTNLQQPTTNPMADSSEKLSKGSATLLKLRQGITGFGTNNGHTAPKPTINSLDIPGFSFDKVSATVSSVATTFELQRFFERLHEEAGVTTDQDRKALSGAFVVYITQNGCSARQDFKDGRMVFMGSDGETSVPASVIPRALNNSDLRRIGNALADLQRALLRANDDVMTVVLGQVSGWAARPKYPDLVLETATHCSGLSVDERKFANLAKIRRLQFSENPNAFIKGKDAETMFDINDVDTQARNRTGFSK
jgi:hypothetical protein